LYLQTHNQLNKNLANNINPNKNDLEAVYLSSNFSLIITKNEFYNNNQEKKALELEIAKKNVLNTSHQSYKYKVKKGDSLEKIAKNFGVKITDLKNLNNLKSDKIVAGQTLLIPQTANVNAKISKNPNPSNKVKATYVSALTEINGILVPTDGLNQKLVHSNNGIDISAPCGTPVYAADEGIVVVARSSGYNSGYGKYILIQHNKYETLYGHLSNVYVTEGDYVNKGELIGSVGNTGYTIGATGCHLHFETRGIKNPLAQ
jgi:murein DD-endopeptidase MepM/ murein hydrolase activator NlpD